MAHEIEALLSYLRQHQPNWNHHRTEHGGIVSIQRYF